MHSRVEHENTCKISAPGLAGLFKLGCQKNALASCIV